MRRGRWGPLRDLWGPLGIRKSFKNQLFSGKCKNNRIPVKSEKAENHLKTNAQRSLGTAGGPLGTSESQKRTKNQLFREMQKNNRKLVKSEKAENLLKKPMRRGRWGPLGDLWGPLEVRKSF